MAFAFSSLRRDGVSRRPGWYQASSGSSFHGVTGWSTVQLPRAARNRRTASPRHQLSMDFGGGGFLGVGTPELVVIAAVGYFLLGPTEVRHSRILPCSPDSVENPLRVKLSYRGRCADSRATTCCPSVVSPGEGSRQAHHAVARHRHRSIGAVLRSDGRAARGERGKNALPACGSAKGEHSPVPGAQITEAASELQQAFSPFSYEGRQQRYNKASVFPPPSRARLDLYVSLMFHTCTSHIAPPTRSPPVICHDQLRHRQSRASDTRSDARSLGSLGHAGHAGSPRGCPSRGCFRCCPGRGGCRRSRGQI